MLINFLGEWIIPTVIAGECMPPTIGFTIENINKTKAIIFGGRSTTGTTSDIYIIDVINKTVVSY